MWSKEILLKPWPEMFYFKGDFLLTFMSICSFLQEFFLRPRLCYDWSWFCTPSFPNFYWRNFPFSNPTQTVEERPAQGPTAGCGPLPGSLCWHLPRALGFPWASEQVWLFNYLCRAGLLKSHPPGTLRDTSCSFFLFKALCQCGR